VFRSALVLTLLCVFLACDPKGGVGTDTGDPPEADADTDTDTDTDTDADTDTGDCLPQIAAAPESLDFGAVSLAFYATGYVEVQSVGCADLVISGFTVTGSADFDLLTHSTADTLAPGESFTIAVGYQTYEAEQDMGELTIISDDPDGALVVPLVGEGT
jgi:hypothetical protein